MTASAFDADWVNIEKDEWIDYKMEKDEVSVCMDDLMSHVKQLSASTIVTVKTATTFVMSFAIMSSDIMMTTASATRLTYHIVKMSWSAATAATTQ